MVQLLIVPPRENYFIQRAFSLIRYKTKLITNRVVHTQYKSIFHCRKMMRSF